MTDYLASIEEKKAEKTLPQFRTFFTISSLPYEVSEHDVSSVVAELVHLGAARIVVERQIIDENAPDLPAPEDDETIEAELLDGTLG